MPVVFHRNMNCPGLVVFLAIVSLTAAQVTLLENKWHSWKERHRKLYSSVKEEADRKQTWLRNVREILHHNSGNHTFMMQPNQFSDMVSHYNTDAAIVISIRLCFHKSEDEFSASFLSLMNMATGASRSKLHAKSNLTSYPSTMDWRERGLVTEVYNIMHYSLSVYSLYNK